MPRHPQPAPQWRNRVKELRYLSPQELADHPLQWREHPDLQQSALRGVLEEVGIAGALLAYESPTTGLLTAIDGHLRKSLGEVAWPVLILDVTDEEAALLLSTHDPLAALAESNKDQLAALLHSVQSGDAAVQQLLSGLAEREGIVPSLRNEDTHGGTALVSLPTISLAEQFLVPPFSVLDARQGYWQARKRAWLALGIQSELGRGQGIVPNGSHLDASQDGVWRRGGAAYENQGRLTALQKTGKSHMHTSASNVAMDLAGGESASHQSGTSIFDPVLCELAYTWFSPPGGTVLDPFAGGSVRGIVAARLGRAYTGIDLRPEQVAANQGQWATISAGVAGKRQTATPAWLAGDSSAMETLPLAPDYDFVFTCPPYADLEQYSDDPRDLSTMAYGAFLATYRHIIAASLARLRDDRFACIVVGDIRGPQGYYRNFVSDTIAAFQDAGTRLYNEAILVTMAGSLPFRAGIPFTTSRKLGKTHQQVLIFVKGNAKRATEVCGPVEVADDLETVRLAEV
jgi:hypothetical protein